MILGCELPLNPADNRATRTDTTHSDVKGFAQPIFTPLEALIASYVGSQNVEPFRDLSRTDTSPRSVASVAGYIVRIPAGPKRS